jgi:diguanylate cyclase (GGDEF)-like protein/PAS domain S-box-containing protein
MDDQNKTKAQLIAELKIARKRILELEQAEAEWVRAQDALRQSEHQLKLITDNLPAYVAYVGLDDLRYQFVNNKFEESYKISRDQIIGSHIKDIIGKSNYEFAQKYLDVVRQGRATSYENRFVTAGTERWVKVNYVPDINAQGKAENVVVLSLDITENKRAEKALQESEERLRQIASSLREVIWLRDVQTRQVLYVNPAFEELTGRTCECFYENRDIVIDAIHPDDKEEVIKALEQRLDGVPYDKELRIVHLDGSVRWVSSRIFPVQNEAGEVYRWASIMEDITERRQAAQALRENEERLDLALTVANDGIWDWYLGSNTVFFDRRFYTMAGYEPDEFPGDFNEWEKRVHPEDIQQTKLAIEQYLAGESEGYDAEFRFLHKNGDYMWIRAKGKIVAHDEEGNPTRFVGTHSDITERVWAKMELQRANKQLQTRLVEIKELETALREQAIRDPLTGSFNRRYMDEVLQQELARTSRKGGAFSVVILDLDHLKEINDNYGHVTGGDKALQTLADTLTHMCREEDTVCRYAGDEFLIILHDTPAHVAYERASQWREAIGRIKITSHGRKFGITFSAGVASFPVHGSTSDGILQNADRALYQAKELGRDQVVVYQMQNSI